MPPGFRCDLVLASPDVEHPSVVTCDDQGNLFIGEDPMDMRGPSTQEIDRVVYLRWDKQGGPPRKTVFCENLSAVFGMVWHEGALYVLHAPHFSMFRDHDGDGVADERRDLVRGLGHPAGHYGFNDHIVSGIELGMDGWVYVSVGDKGIPQASGSDGSTLTLEGGGIVRMRLDGSSLESFSHGTRNHLEPVLDAADNIFTLDNSDDGAGWWTKLIHHVETGYYGYPYEFRQPSRRLDAVAEYGGGAPAGGACYRESAWPAEYRGNLFFCEWGRQAVERIELVPAGATFTAKRERFLSFDDDSSFRPLDVCFSPDGQAMYVADWNFGGWTQPVAAGRIFRVTRDAAEPQANRGPDQPPQTTTHLVARLAHPSYHHRTAAQRRIAGIGTSAIQPLAEVLQHDGNPTSKIHAIWALQAIGKCQSAMDAEVSLLGAVSDQDAGVRAQAIRALGEVGDERSCATFRRAANTDADASVRLQAVIGLGRARYSRFTSTLCSALVDQDPTVRFAARQAIRRLGSFSSVKPILEGADAELSEAIVAALAGVYDDQAVAVLDALSRTADSPDLRAQAVSALAEVRLQAAPYTGEWWSTQPARGTPRRKKVNAWSGTPVVKAALEIALNDPASTVRVAAIDGLVAAAVYSEPLTERLAHVARGDAEPLVRVAAAKYLSAQPHAAGVGALCELLVDDATPSALKESLPDLLAWARASGAAGKLADIAADQKREARSRAACLAALARSKDPAAVAAIEGCLRDPDAAIRVAALESGIASVGQAFAKHAIAALDDQAPVVRKAGLDALEQRPSRDAVPALLYAAENPDLAEDALEALATIPDNRSLQAYLSGLTHANDAVREKCSLAIAALHAEGTSELDEFRNSQPLSLPQRLQLQGALSRPVPIRDFWLLGSWPKWRVQPTFDYANAPAKVLPVTVARDEFRWTQLQTDDPRGRFMLSDQYRLKADCWTVAYAPIESPAARKAELVVGSDDQLRIFLNGRQVYDFHGDRGWQAENARIPVDLNSGTNHLWLWTGNTDGAWSFHVAVTPSVANGILAGAADPQHHRASLEEFAISHPGDAAQGERLFFDTARLACSKCHKLRQKGADIGPELSEIATKYTKREIARSVLYPSERIADAFRMQTIVTIDGRIVEGMVAREDESHLHLTDSAGTRLSLPKDQIETREAGNRSAMPEGACDLLTAKEFADLITFLTWRTTDGGSALLPRETSAKPD